MVLTQHFKRLRQKMRNRAGRRSEPNAPDKPLHLAVNIV
ncbi:hypothetical protein BSLA_02f2507 [Burkholderia stabilis]|nr:hypothetical protein BSLA_02f2507 [Burkholderia stabilis]